MFKKKDGTEVDDAAEAPATKLADAAYEDSWYRSLKAMAETLGIEGAEKAEEDDDDEAGSEA